MKFENETKYYLNKIQKEFVWNRLNMGEIYSDEDDNVYANLCTCIDKDWFIYKNYNIWKDDYPFTLVVGISEWDDLTLEFVNEILEMEE